MSETPAGGHSADYDVAIRAALLGARHAHLTIEQAADRIRVLLAQAWDEGYLRGRPEIWKPPGNPYAATVIASAETAEGSSDE